MKWFGTAVVLPLASAPLIYYFWQRRRNQHNDYWNVIKVFNDSKQLLEATALLNSVQTDIRGNIETVPLTWEEKKEVTEFWRYATSVYGDLLNRVPGLYDEPFAGDLEAFTNMNGIDSSDIHFKEDYSQKCIPAHVVAIDWAKSAIVVAIRGTLWFSDIATDLSLSMIDCEVDGINGAMHKGFHRTGHNLADLLTEELEDALAKWHEKRGSEKPRLILTGHSLGAAAASVLFLELYRRREEVFWEFDDVKVYAYAPPAMFTEPLASCELVNDYVRSFVIEDDIVPSLSHGSVLDFVEKVTKVCDILGNGEKIGTLAKSEELATMLNKDNGDREKLLPPGKVCLYRESDGMGWVKNEDRNKVFGSIIISANMFLDHMPSRYSEALKLEKVPLSNRIKGILNL